VCRATFSCFVCRTHFRGPKGDGSRFQVLRDWTHFQRYRQRRVLFYFFARPDSFSVVSRASGPVFRFCASRLIFGGNEGAGYSFHVSAVPRASCLVFKFCAPRLIFGGTTGIGSRFHVLRSRTHFQRCATLFRALRTAAGRWDAEEGHGDPSQACIILMPADSAV
jgi:hypothetical protein